MPRILSEHRLTEHLTTVEIEAPEIASSAAPGQVVLIRFDRHTPRTPKVIASMDRVRGTVTVLRQDARRETPPQPAAPRGHTESPATPAGPAAPRGHSEPPATPAGPAGGTFHNDTMDIDVTGPLGHPPSLDKASKSLFIAAGTGIGAVLPRLRELKGKGCYTMVIAGYPSKNGLFWMDQLDEVSDELYVVTDDGSYGIKGPLRHTLRAVCEQTGDIDYVHAAGPLKLLKTTADVTANFGLSTTVNLATVLDDADNETPDDPANADLHAAERERFDWATSTDLDAHKLDFDRLARALGVPLSK